MLEIVNVSKEFGKLRAIDDISLNVEKGEIRGLIGPNGSGKTTLFNLISGFLRPTRGKIVWGGKNIAGESPHAIARKGIIRTFQLTSVYADFTVMQNTIMACHLQTGMSLFDQFAGSKRARQKEKTIEKTSMRLLEMMGLEQECDRVAKELPGGTQKILAIAIALAGGPKLLMLDEPLAGLNTSEKTIVMEKVKILRDRGITIFIVEHDMKAIMNTCDRVTVINFGQRIAEGSPEEVSSDRRTIEAYLGKEEQGSA
jgi:branched-chain amino acid transport system ATP-binding protein